ncbi:MAG TPA: TetR/AcrR family transcriptional regulator [Candidatus Kapabacteria bacterium]|nr:TetR/AcrR family transcriptional regulator [Candidatus Kapabacteria bacterium]
MMEPSIRSKPLSRKDQIRQKAQTLFRERGYRATSMRDLAETLGMEAASLYNHISSKEELLQQICFAMASQFFEAVEPVAASALAPKEKLRAAIEAHLSVIAANSDASAVFLHEWRHMGEPLLNDFKLMRRRYEQIFRKIIDDGIAKESFRNIDAMIAARTILSGTNWTYETHKSHGKLSSQNLSEIATILLEGIVTK